VYGIDSNSRQSFHWGVNNKERWQKRRVSCQTELSHRVDSEEHEFVLECTVSGCINKCQECPTLSLRNINLSYQIKHDHEHYFKKR